MEEWIKIEPKEGLPGKTEVTISAEEHTGRLSREGIVTFKAKSDSSVSNDLKVFQSGKDEFIHFDGILKSVIAKEGGLITIAGTTNTLQISFKLTGEIEIDLPEKFHTGLYPAYNNSPIENDPGQRHEFIFSINLYIPENKSKHIIYSKLIAIAHNGSKSEIVIEQIF